jgi:hypothetical protein
MSGAIAPTGKDYVRQYGRGVTPFMAEAVQRRSARVLLDVPVAIWGESPDEQGFREETFTVTVSAHGALVMLAAKVSVGQRVVLRKLTDSIEIRGRIADVGMPHAGLTQVGIELDEPSPGFWPVCQPPTDWMTR